MRYMLRLLRVMLNIKNKMQAPFPSDERAFRAFDNGGDFHFKSFLNVRRTRFQTLVGAYLKDLLTAHLNAAVACLGLLLRELLP